MLTQFHGHQGRRIAGSGINEDNYGEESVHGRDWSGCYPYWVVPNYSRKAWEDMCGPVIIIRPAKKGSNADV